jgi:hypothetical protein
MSSSNSLYEQKKELLDEDAVVYENPRYEDALIGRECQDGRAVYDYSKMIDCLIEEGMTHEEAVEWIDYNVLGLRGDAKFPVVVEMFEGVL